MNPEPQIILYPDRIGRQDFALHAAGRTIWLTQLEVPDLFQTTKQNVSLHRHQLANDRGRARHSVVKESLTTAANGENHRTRFYRMRESNKRTVLQGPGRMSHSRMEEIAGERYEEFGGRRREAERLAADAEDVKALESLSKEIEAVKPMKKHSKPSGNPAGEEVGE